MRKFLLMTVFALVGLAYAAVSRAGQNNPLQLSLPIECEPGRTCWLVNLVDLDPGPGIVDYKSGRQTYDGHKGTDLAIRDLSVMKKGVAVLAAAPGRVKGVRDGMADINVKIIGLENIKGRECGNGVLIDHGDGWTTQYCHLRKNSVRVAVGEQVKRGQIIGLVGNSGRAQFPHVHITVRYQGRVLDPFIGGGAGSGKLTKKISLWTIKAAKKLNDAAPGPFNAGFAAIRPKPRAIRRGLYQDEILPARSPALVFWAETYWPRTGDMISMRMLDPDGNVLAERSEKMEKTRAFQMFYIGLKRKALFWPKGEYTGEIILTRKPVPGGRPVRQILKRRLQIK